MYQTFNMRAVVIEKFDGPEELKLVSLSIPKPKTKEVCVRVVADRHRHGRTCNLEFVHHLGADHIIYYHTQDFVQVVHQYYLFSIDLVLDTLSGNIQTLSFDVLKTNGHLVSIVAQPDQEVATAKQVSARVHPLCFPAFYSRYVIFNFYAFVTLDICICTLVPPSFQICFTNDIRPTIYILSKGVVNLNH